MGTQQRTRHFKINPVELAIFSGVSLIFLNSVYNLFYDHGGFHPKALEPMASNPISEGRSPASISPLFMMVELKCEPSLERQTSANKLRLTGDLCGASTPSDLSKLVKTQIFNASNHFTATVFTDTASSKFSTDYIPLAAGKNLVRVEFQFQGGRTISQDLNVDRQ